MGCCLSSASNPYPHEASSSSARAINHPIGNAASSFPSPTQISQSPSRSARRRDPEPLDHHINKPLKRHTWASTSRGWTRQQLDSERREFFDTRVTGRPEIWQNIHAALQVLWEAAEEEELPREAGKKTAEKRDSNLATAQSILDAGEISVPTGNLVNGVYDSLGNFYQLPAWVVADPEDIVAAEEETEEMLDDDLERRREKGKNVPGDAAQVTLRARLSETGKDIIISTRRDETVKSVAKRLVEESGLESKKIRIAYMGKMLKPQKTLEAQGWQNEHMVNAMVFPA